MSAIGTKRTWACALHMSAFDPKRTLGESDGAQNTTRGFRRIRRCKTGRPALGLTIILNFSLSVLLGGNWIPVLPEKRPMHKSPSQIARLLRAFRYAHRLGLLRGVRMGALLGGNRVPVLLEERPMHKKSQLPLACVSECAQARLVARRSHSARTEAVRSHSRTVRYGISGQHRASLATSSMHA